MKKTLLMLVWWSLPGGAQDPMSLRDAVHLALDKNKSVEASVAANRRNFLKIAPAGRLAGTARPQGREFRQNPKSSTASLGERFLT